MHNIKLLSKGGNVKRYHTETLIGHQKVSEHSWGVAVIIDRLWPEASKQLILAAIYHDTAEGRIGDIPAPTKVAFRDGGAAKLIDDMEEEFHELTGTNYEANLNSFEKAKLKLADYLELVLFCKQQHRMGNSLLRKVEEKGKEYISTLLKNNDRFQSLSSEKIAWIQQTLS